MRAPVFAFVAAIGCFAQPAFAQADRSAAAFWRGVQSACNATAAKPPSELGRRIAQNAIDEFNRFGGHRIDATGRLFHFGLTEAEHEEDDGGSHQANAGRLGWWQVMNYWRSLYGGEAAEKLEVRGYGDASAVSQGSRSVALLRTSAAQLLRLADQISDPEAREILRETAVRSAAVDTSWSAAFISHVVKQAGVTADAFRFANAHRIYIYDAFETSAAELDKRPSGQIYRACPLDATRIRPGDLICQQRESALSDATDEAVRERIRLELGGGAEARTIRRTHCEVVAHVDAGAQKAYTIGGNVNQSVTARKVNLRRGLKFSAMQKGRCGGPGAWTLPPASNGAERPANHKAKCSLNDRKWFVLLQLR